MLNFNWISDLSEGWARFLVIMAFIIPLIFAFMMKKKYIYRGAPDKQSWRNLKFWVLIIVAVQVAIYLYLN